VLGNLPNGHRGIPFYPKSIISHEESGSWNLIPENRWYIWWLSWLESSGTFSSIQHHNYSGSTMPSEVLNSLPDVHLFIFPGEIIFIDSLRQPICYITENPTSRQQMQFTNIKKRALRKPINLWRIAWGRTLIGTRSQIQTSQNCCNNLEENHING